MKSSHRIYEPEGLIYHLESQYDQLSPRETELIIHAFFEGMKNDTARHLNAREAARRASHEPSDSPDTEKRSLKEIILDEIEFMRITELSKLKETE